MKIKVLVSKHPQLKGKILEARKIPLMLGEAFQCIEGEYMGCTLSLQDAIEVDDLPISKAEYTELKQENLQRLEEVKGLQSKLESAKEWGNKVNKLGIQARNELIFAESRANSLEVEKGLLLAQVERAMLDHQPVELPKEVVKEIDYLLTGLTSMGIANLVSNKKGNGLTNHCISWVYKDDSKTVERQNLFLKALDNGYTVEQTVEEANEAAFRAGMEAIYEEMDKEPFNSTAEKRAELAGRLIPLIKEIYKH